MYNCEVKEQAREVQSRLIKDLKLEKHGAFFVPYEGLLDVKQILEPNEIDVSTCSGIVWSSSAYSVGREHGMWMDFGDFRDSAFSAQPRTNVAIIDYHFMATDRVAAALQRFATNVLLDRSFVSINYYTPREPGSVWHNYMEAKKWYEKRFGQVINSRDKYLDAFTMMTLDKVNIKTKILDHVAYRAPTSPSIMHIVMCELTKT